MPEGKYACTFYQPVAEICGNTLLKLSLATGRTHQIRIIGNVFFFIMKFSSKILCHDYDIKHFYEQNTIRLTIAQTTAYLNDGAYTLDAAPIVLNGRTMLPIRFIAESFGFTVDWNPEQQLVTIAFYR